MIFFAISARDLRPITSSGFGAPATVSEREEELVSEHVVASDCVRGVCGDWSGGLNGPEEVGDDSE